MVLKSAIKIIFTFFAEGFANMKNLRRFAFHSKQPPVSLKKIAR